MSCMESSDAHERSGQYRKACRLHNSKRSLFVSFPTIPLGSILWLTTPMRNCGAVNDGGRIHEDGCKKSLLMAPTSLPTLLPLRMLAILWRKVCLFEKMVKVLGMERVELELPGRPADSYYEQGKSTYMSTYNRLSPPSFVSWPVSHGPSFCIPTNSQLARSDRQKGRKQGQQFGKSRE